MTVEREIEYVVGKPVPAEMLTPSRRGKNLVEKFERTREVWRRICEKIPPGYAQRINARAPTVMGAVYALIERGELKDEYIVITRGPKSHREWRVPYIVHLPDDQDEKNKIIKQLKYIPHRKDPRFKWRKKYPPVECDKCGYSWTPKVENPKRCPKYGHRLKKREKYGS